MADQKYDEKMKDAAIERLKAEIEELREQRKQERRVPYFAEDRIIRKEREYPAWNFACPGKSLEAWNGAGRQHMLDGPLVAVNSAIGVVEDADVWLVTRIPRDMQLVLDDFGIQFDDVVRDRQIVWMNRGIWSIHFERNGRCADAIVKTYPNRKLAFERSLLKFESRVEWSKTVPLGGVGRAIAMGGKHVRIFGADMKGEGYAGIPAGPNTWRNDESADQYRRWKRDRVSMGYAINDAANGGVLIQVAGFNWTPGEEVPLPERVAPVLASVAQDGEPETRPMSTEQYLSNITATNPTMRPHREDPATEAAIVRATAAMQRRAKQPMTEAEKGARSARETKTL